MDAYKLTALVRSSTLKLRGVAWRSTDGAHTRIESGLERYLGEPLPLFKVELARIRSRVESPRPRQLSIT